MIRRTHPTEQIDRQVWLTFALATVALVQLNRSQELRAGVGFPAFGLYSHFDQPVLFWQDGVVVVKYAGDEHVPDLRVMADHLKADLVRTDS